MIIPTEPIGSIPRPAQLVAAAIALEAMYEAALRDTIERFEATGSPVITELELGGGA